MASGSTSGSVSIHRSRVGVNSTPMTVRIRLLISPSSTAVWTVRDTLS